MSLPDYEQVNAALSISDNLPSAAEVHGLICGFICAGKKMDGKSWLEPILGHLQTQNKDVVRHYKQLLLQIYEISNLKLQSFEFDFELLIPDDDTDLHYRAEALSHWCQGFLIAMHRAGIDFKQMPASEAKEAIQNISEISQLDYDTIGEVTEKDEMAYAEVMEYVRMAVLMVYSEFVTEQGNLGLRSGSKQLH